MPTRSLFRTKFNRSLRLGVTFLAIAVVSACAPTTQQPVAGQLSSGAIHYTVSGPATYNRNPPGTRSYSANVGIALGTALANAAQAASAVQRIANSLPELQADPATQLSSSIMASLSSRPNITPGQAVPYGQFGSPQERAAWARMRGLSGALLTVSETEVRFYGTGAATQVGGNRVFVGLTAAIALVDVPSGEVIARSSCQESSRTRRAEVQAGLQGFATREIGAHVQNCAAAFLGRVQ